MTTSCNRFRKVTLDGQCASIVAEAGISLADFYSWNPAVGSKCTTLWADNYVCTGIIGSTPTEPVDNGVATPATTHPGMTNHCNKFYLVKANDQCGSVASSQGISLTELYGTYLSDEPTRRYGQIRTYALVSSGAKSQPPCRDAPVVVSAFLSPPLGLEKS